MSVEGKVMWAELQQELSAVGLKVSVNIPTDSIWNGTIEDKLFTMSIPRRNRDKGYRDWLVVSLYGQEEESVIAGLNAFMGYSTFCKYKNRINHQATATYEWDRVNPQKRLEELIKKEEIFDVERIEKGLKPHSPSVDMSQVYHEFTPELVAQWEELVRKNPKAEWDYYEVPEILPFIKATMPRIGKNQSLFAFSIISLERTYPDEESVVRYGLEPLAKSGILTAEEVGQIVDWYGQTTPTWHSNNDRRFEKTLEVGSHKYRLYTDCYRGCRDLNLQVV